MAQAKYLETDNAPQRRLYEKMSIDDKAHGFAATHLEKDSLVRRLAVDSAAAGIAALFVAPAMTIIDK